MKELNFETGLVEMTVNGGRTVRFNPADMGFLETVYGLLAKLEAVEADTAKKRAKTDDLAKQFDHARTSDRRMREAVDSVFGEGFCADVFPGIRLTALADGLTVLENFLFALIDEMDESVRGNLAKREGRIAKYTAKYQAHKNVVPMAAEGCRDGRSAKPNDVPMA